MYQTLYRKYRPQTFDEVVGQDLIVRTLKNEINHNRLNHAYLFTGPRGVGKTSIAKILAKTVNCENLKDCIPCGECPSCLEINAKQSTDIIEIDAASNNGVDEIRELRSKVNLVPSTGKYKVYIIDEVHMLTVGAFNALLKTLEEPPEHIIFILATTDPHKIPLTILSRCQRFDFKKIAINDIVKLLEKIVKEENINIETSALATIARLADGGLRDSLSMLDQVIAYASDTITEKDVHAVNGTLSQEELKEFFEQMFLHNIKYCIEFVNQCNDDGKNLVKLGEEMIEFLRNLLLAKTVPELVKTNIEIYEDLSNKNSISDVTELIYQFNDSLQKMKNSNYPKMILELLIIKQTASEQIKTSNFEKESIQAENNTTIEQKKTVSKGNDFPGNTVLSQQTKEKKLGNNSTVKKKLQINKDKLEELKKIRIENTLAKFNKKEMLKIRNSLHDEIRNYLLDPAYSHLASLLLDGAVKASSDEYMIIVFDEEGNSETFNENLIEIEKLVSEIYHQNYKMISLTLTEWEPIKNAFNTKSRNFHYQNETIHYNDIFKHIGEEEKKQNEIDELFGNIVEYK